MKRQFDPASPGIVTIKFIENRRLNWKVIVVVAIDQ